MRGDPVRHLAEEHSSQREEQRQQRAGGTARRPGSLQPGEEAEW